MSRHIKLILVLAGLLAGVWLLYAKGIKRWYLEPRAAALQDIARAQTLLADYRRNQDDHPRVLKELQMFTDRSFGGERETVDHKFRTRLNRLAEAQGLVPSVTTLGEKQRETPARSKFTAIRALREEPDFHEVSGRVTGTGNFEQVLGLIASIEAEPWIKRIDQMRLDSRDNGAKFNFSLDLTTLYLPGKSPRLDRVPPASQIDLAQFAALLQNPFRMPPPAQPVKVASADPPPKQGFPYDQWLITGIAESPYGPEIWLINGQTNESRRLAIGETLEDIVLVSAHGEAAEFHNGNERFVVTIGTKLSDRQPVKQ